MCRPCLHLRAGLMGLRFRHHIRQIGLHAPHAVDEILGSHVDVLPGLEGFLLLQGADHAAMARLLKPVDFFEEVEVNT